MNELFNFSFGADFVGMISMIILESKILNRIAIEQEKFHDDVFEIAKLAENLEIDVDSFLLENLAKICSSETEESTPEIRVARFLLSMTLKDLSIMISIDSSGTTNNRDLGGSTRKIAIEMSKPSTGFIVTPTRTLKFGIKIVDLDQKMSRKLKIWSELESDLLSSF